MQKKLKHFLLKILFPFWGFAGLAQTYPVTIYSHLSYPTPIYLSNYANTATIDSPIQIQLTLNDLNIMNRQVRLKFYLQGRMTLVSKDYVVGAMPIYLQGGGLTQLTNVQLGPYFELKNLQGINPNQYGQPLPEGMYDFCVEVYDFITNKRLSNKTCVSAVIFQNDPPFLNLPVNNEKIMQQDIQNIIFNWTPRNINVSNVEYEFSLVELWNPNIPYQTAFDYAPPLYTETIRTTTLQYDMMKPQLIPGKSYAWRVKAKALKGAEEIGMFKNNGFSEVFTFKYLTNCRAPISVTTTGVSQDQAKVTWIGDIANWDYQVSYREKNARSKWYTIITPRQYSTITNLKPNTTYEYTVGAACDLGEYTLSRIEEFTTLAHDEIAFAGCNLKPDPADLTNKTPLPALFPNDVVMAGDFPIVVLHATGSNGTFSGDGFVTFPFIEKFKQKIGGAIDANSKSNVGIKIIFNNIGVNTDFKLISGEIVASYDKDWGSMIDGDKLAKDIREFLNNYKGTDEDKTKAEELHKMQDQWSANLIADANLPQDEKTKIISAQKNAQDSWNGLENGNDCNENIKTNEKSTKNGPNADDYFVEKDFDCYKSPVENQIKTNEEAVDALIKPLVPITKELLASVFPDTDPNRLEEVANAINKYSNKFEITTPERMSHFLAQIGTETGGLKKLQETTCYKSKDRIKEIFGKVKYCDLFEGYESDLTKCDSDGTPTTCKPALNKITPNLVIKDKYVCSSTLIDYTYSCRMSNGPASSGEGSKFLGKGFIHLTGKSQFQNISALWNADPENAKNQKDFTGKDIGEITDNLEVAMKASMYYWKDNDLNALADKGIDDNQIDKLGAKINGAIYPQLPNSYKDRRMYTTNVFKVLNK